jgi:outer membrane receptor protein involved in Fe transport
MESVYTEVPPGVNMAPAVVGRSLPAADDLNTNRLTNGEMKMKRIAVVLLIAAMITMMSQPQGMATETDAPQGKPVHQLDEMVVEAPAGAPGIEQTPAETVIDVQKLPTIGVPNSVVDILKGHAIIDFRGESDIDPGVDSIYMRGFDAKRFVTALDGLTVQKTGGRKSSNIVDYALIPAFLIDSVEIIPGPHSALYDSKSIGGTLNFKTQRPVRRDTLRPEGRLATSYESYNTQTHNVLVQGAVQAVTYDLAYQKRSSDGYLRNNATDIDTVYGRVGLILPSDGFITLSAFYADEDREAPVTNTGADEDSDYPEVEKAAFAPWQKPTWDGISNAYRFNYEQDSPVGRLSAGAYYGTDKRDRAYYADPGDTRLTHMDTDWWQQGGRVQDEIQWSPAHTTTLGFDLAKLYDEGVDDEKTDRIDKKGGYLQHQWGILPSLDLRLGLRYEAVAIRVSNWSRNDYHIQGRGKWIDRDWDQFMPKSFVTWRMDAAAPWLRDTSLSVGVSKIWRAPDYHGDYNPQGRPAGAFLDPEHGIGYDVALNRRLWRDITLKVNYAFYQIYDFIASNSAYARNSGPDAGRLRYSDYKVNLDEVHRHGVDLELGGHLTDALSFYLTYTWQKFYNQGDEPAGETELDQRAEHHLTAGLAYALFEPTTLLLDYCYQTREITEESVGLANGDWYFMEKRNPAHGVFDIGLQQRLFQWERLPAEAYLKLYIKNLFDESYNNASGYPATDRTYGAALSVDF